MSVSVSMCVHWKLPPVESPLSLRIFNVNHDGSLFVDLIAEWNTRANVRVSKSCRDTTWDWDTAVQRLNASRDSRDS